MNIEESASKAPRSFPLPIIIGLALPILFACNFYFTYSQTAWFYQDDFGFIDHYTSSIRLHELFDFSNFGRFVSRNCYWHLGLQSFSRNAQCFYIFNFLTILATCFLLYRLFSEKYGRFSGAVSGLFYFTLPATVESYRWLSNSQHLLGHFFVILFIYLFNKEDLKAGSEGLLLRTVSLTIVLILGFASNIFMAMVLSLPTWTLLTEKSHRKLRSTYVALLVGMALFAVFFDNLSRAQTGAYATAYTLPTLVTNARYYFNNMELAALWFISMTSGAFYAFLKKQYFVSWLFLASLAFFFPFAFFTHQRYGQYGALTYLFCLLAIWSILREELLFRWPRVAQYVGATIVLFVFSKSLQPIRHFTQNPLGATQRQQIDFLRTYAAQHPNVKHYCFQTEKKFENSTGVKEWDLPPDWWFVGFGTAFRLFVSQENEYALPETLDTCDAVFVFKSGRLTIPPF